LQLGRLREIAGGERQRLGAWWTLKEDTSPREELGLAFGLIPEAGRAKTLKSSGNAKDTRDGPNQ